MKFNEATLIQTIENLKMDIMQAQQNLEAMKLHKTELDTELKTLRLTPPPDAIKNALIRLGMYPKLKPQTRREENDTKQHTAKDISSIDLCEGSDPTTTYESSNGVLTSTYTA